MSINFNMTLPLYPDRFLLFSRFALVVPSVILVHAACFSPIALSFGCRSISVVHSRFLVVDVEVWIGIWIGLAARPCVCVSKLYTTISYLFMAYVCLSNEQRATNNKKTQKSERKKNNPKMEQNQLQRSYEDAEEKRKKTESNRTRTSFAKHIAYMSSQCFVCTFPSNGCFFLVLLRSLLTGICLSVHSLLNWLVSPQI